MGKFETGAPAPRSFAAAGPAAATVALDLSRLLSRAGRATPTGIDRVEFAYAEHFLRGERNGFFVATTAGGRLGLLRRETAARFVEAIGAAWRGTGDPARQDREVRRIAWQARLALMSVGERAVRVRLADPTTRPLYLLVSHHHLEKHGLFARLRERSAARFVFLIHDLIPIEFPEYAKPGQAENHGRRIAAAVRFADGMIVNSAATAAGLQPHLDRAGRAPPVLVAPFGADLPAADVDGTPPYARPYFVYVGTIEARKNHLLLLLLWRRLAAELGERAPILVLIGQRGWEAESAIDLLDRCPALRGCVIEHANLPDGDMVRLLKGARALLLPSFAEGFGFPVVEALQLGVPALCSDIPALRETGGGVPEFLDPLDGPGWRAAVLDYAAPQSPRRAAQMARLAGWSAPRWPDHFTAVDRFIAAVAAAPARARA
ncbi:MAG TPA: glycosyltransferase family 1 protein [Stellaceae bacterium]|nr:glycosyltransferase family 1 protein [Stellaceae bacterium]